MDAPGTPTPAPPRRDGGCVRPRTGAPCTLLSAPDNPARAGRTPRGWRASTRSGAGRARTGPEASGPLHRREAREGASLRAPAARGSRAGGRRRTPAPKACRPRPAPPLVARPSGAPSRRPVSHPRQLLTAGPPRPPIFIAGGRTKRSLCELNRPSVCLRIKIFFLNKITRAPLALPQGRPVSEVDQDLCSTVPLRIGRTTAGCF